MFSLKVGLTVRIIRMLFAGVSKSLQFFRRNFGDVWIMILISLPNLRV